MKIITKNVCSLFNILPYMLIEHFTFYVDNSAGCYVFFNPILFAIKSVERNYFPENGISLFRPEMQNE